MNKEILKLIGNYFNWIKFSSKLIKTHSDWYIIQTPFTDVSNDIIEVFIRIGENDNIEISDNGNTLTNLSIRQFDLTNEKIENIQKNILNGYDIKIIDNELCSLCESKNFNSYLNNFIQSIIQIDSLYVYQFI